HGSAIGHEGDAAEILDTALAQVLHGGTDLLEGHTRIEKSFDHSQHEDVAESIETLGARSSCGADRGLNEPCARPVVELAIGDACRLARCRTAIASRLIELG